MLLIEEKYLQYQVEREVILLGAIHSSRNREAVKSRASVQEKKERRQLHVSGYLVYLGLNLNNFRTAKHVFIILLKLMLVVKIPYQRAIPSRNHLYLKV